MSETAPSNPWSSLLRSLPLSKSESDVVRRFEAEPEGRSFLPLADILRAHRLTDEALEILTQGVERHPNFSVARVVLSRELLQKGMIEAAWRVLQESPTSLRSNVMAQKLRFKLALLLSLDHEANSLIQYLQLEQLHDRDTKRLADLAVGKSLAKAREKLLEELRERGVTPLLPPLGQEASTQERSDQEGQSLDAANAQLVSSANPTLDDGEKDTTLPKGVSDYLDAAVFIQNDSLSAFHVTALTEIFRPENAAAPELKGAGGVELDSTTLAEIYAGQGHYGKALEMYRRILRVAPQNDLVKRRVAELARLEREQRTADLTIDPTLVDLMESVEIIDRQIKFYNDLLTRLS